MKSITLKLLIINCIVMVVFALLFFYQTYSRTNKRISQVVNQQAALALQFDLSIRQYVADFIRPAMYELTSDDDFFPETMSTSYIARSIFEDVQKRFPDYILKFSSDNPRNPLNKAGPEELKIIEKFNKQPQLKQWEGQITIDNKKYLAKFSVRRMVASCARCHGDPKDAPASLVERYGDKAGFYMNLGDVLGLDTVAIPMIKIIDQQRSEFFKVSFLGGLGIVLFFTLSILITRYLIINRLSIISKHFLDVAQEKDYRQIQPIAMKGNDEITDLSVSFNIMAERLKESYTFLNDQVNLRTAELQNEIIEHKQSEEKLRQSEEKFRAAFKTSPYVITLTGVEDGTYVDINDAFTKLLGYPPEEIIGVSSLEINIWNDPKDRDQLVAGLKKDGFVENLEADFKGKNGQIINGLMSARTLEIGDKKYLLAVTQDMTKFQKNEKERLNLEIRLQQTQKMEAIGTLAGGIAHDFNNILFPILGYSEMLLDDVPIDSQIHGSLNKIHTGALRAKDLVQQILTFSRQEKSDLKLMKIQPIIKEVLKFIRSTIPTTIDIKQEIQVDCGVIKADPTQIHQIVMNLATNAYHAMEKTGGELKVSLKEIELGEYDVINPDMTPGDYACLKVADKGRGMDKNLIDKIFDPFFTTKAIGEGTGMGLSVVHGIVTGMGGAIRIYSEPGQGTEFTVYLPVEKNSSEEKERLVKQPIQGGSEHILLVDDEEAIITMEKQMLERMGYKVTSRSSSIEAFEVFRDNPDKFDLIITDMAMPNLSGDKLAVELIKIRHDIPILLCTGFSENMPQGKAAFLGIKDFLFKPIVMKDLAQKIREVLDKKNINA